VSSIVPSIEGSHSLSILISVTPEPGIIGGSSHMAVNEKAESITTIATEAVKAKNLKCLFKRINPFYSEREPD
jgi:hypothetical protein